MQNSRRTTLNSECNLLPVTKQTSQAACILFQAAWSFLTHVFLMLTGMTDGENAGVLRLLIF
jgi:hypothetical protein